MLHLNSWLKALVLILVLLATPAHAANVLILDDDHGTEVANNLTGAGHTVTSVLYYNWDGSNPSPAGFDAVLLLKGEDYGYELGNDAGSPAYAALVQYVQNGGVFASTEWLIYDMGDSGYNLALAPYVPFEYTTYLDYNYAGTYTVLQPTHPLAANLPLTWDTVDNADGGSCATLKPGAIVMISRSMDYYDQECMDAFALAYIRVGNGVSIHLNSDLGHENSVDATPELLQIIRNIVVVEPSVIISRDYGSGIPVPTLSFWALLLLIGLVSLIGLRRVIPRGHKP